MSYSGHRWSAPNYEQILRNRALTPRKPTLDGEPSYENHPMIGEESGYYQNKYQWDRITRITSRQVRQLANDGVLFRSAFSTTPVCSTSRSSFMTGMLATTIGAHNHRSHRDDGYQLPEGVCLLTDWLRDAGYFTANVVHFPQQDRLKGTGKTDWNFQYEGKPFDSNRWSDLKDHQPI